MVEAVRVAEKALGSVTYEISEKEQASRALRRSLFVVENIKAGEPFTRTNVRSIRPGQGLPVKELDRILGKQAAVGIQRGTPLAEDHVC
jgi:sialic acid synthase SpsE